MIKQLSLDLPHTKRNVTIEVSLPLDYDGKTPCDTVYLLDGQNAFIDSHATFNRSIRASKYLNKLSKEIKRPLLGVAIYNAMSDLGRINEYTPYKITHPANKNWKKQNTDVFQAFVKDLTETIVPTIESLYPTSNKRLIYGSSLAALTAIYLGYHFDIFEGVGAFSTASFLCPNEMRNFIKQEIKKNVRIFLYVGKLESSDDLYEATLYYNESLDLHELISNLGGNCRLVVSEKGTHCEATWEKQLMDFLCYMYSDSIIFKN